MLKFVTIRGRDVLVVVRVKRFLNCGWGTSYNSLGRELKVRRTGATVDTVILGAELDGAVN